MSVSQAERVRRRAEKPSVKAARRGQIAHLKAGLQALEAEVTVEGGDWVDRLNTYLSLRVAAQVDPKQGCGGDSGSGGVCRGGAL